MRIVFLMLFGLLFSVQASAQILHNKRLNQLPSDAPSNQFQQNPVNQVRQNNMVRSETNTSQTDEQTEYEPESQMIYARMRDYGDQKDARNIKIVEAVAHYKLGDEKLREEMEKLDQNREYNKKMKKIIEKLSNDKRRDTKNREVVRILQEAGNKLYNLLAD